MFTAGGIAIGAYLRHREDGIVAKRDAITRDYIMRHPEDFPPPGKLHLIIINTNNIHE